MEFWLCFAPLFVAADNAGVLLSAASREGRISKMDSNIKTNMIPVDEARILAHEALAAMTA